MYFVIHCTDRSDTAATRERLMAEHRAYLDSQLDIIVWAGAQMDDSDRVMRGSLFIVNVPDRTAAEAFSAGDPFTAAGVFARIEISRVRRGIFRPELARTSGKDTEL
ncbi:MAG: YciI family protein [Alphaproteobacteria bacterium]|nr:YciI family protein [Alphaproteobacteria bacterium]